jgi:hypothetical protein
MAYTKKDKCMWISHGTIHLCLHFFRGSRMVIFEMNFFICTTYNIIYVHELYHIFWISRNITCNNGIRAQLVTKNSLSTCITLICNPLSEKHQQFQRRQGSDTFTAITPNVFNLELSTVANNKPEVRLLLERQESNRHSLMEYTSN